MTATEPNGWELKRSIDQMREDFREDLTDLKADLSDIGNKIDSKFDDLERRFPTRSDHNALVGRVATLETNAAKRSERTSTQWLAWGTTTFAALVGVIMGVVALVVK